MRHWILGSIGAALIAAGLGCGSDEKNNDDAGAGGGPTAGTAAGGGTASGGGEDGGEGGGEDAPCTVNARGLEVSRDSGITPSIAWIGEGFAVAWRDRGAEDEGNIHLAVLDADGAKLGGAVIDDGPAVSTHPVVQRDGDGLLVLWQDESATGSTLRGRRTSLAGEPAGAAFDLTTSGSAESWPIAAASQDGVVVTWMDATGSQLGLLSGDALGTPTPLDQAKFPSVVAEGDEVVLGWAHGDALGFARLGEDGTVGAPVSHPGVTPKLTRVALGGDDAFLVWEDARSGAEQIRAVRVSADDELSSEAVVSPGDTSANWPALAWNGSELAIAYYQFRDGPPVVYLTFLGTDLKPRGIELAVSGDDPARYPALAWTGEEFAVAYAENDQGIRLSLASCR